MNADAITPNLTPSPTFAKPDVTGNNRVTVAGSTYVLYDKAAACDPGHPKQDECPFGKCMNTDVPGLKGSQAGYCCNKGETCPRVAGVTPAPGSTIAPTAIPHSGSNIVPIHVSKSCEKPSDCNGANGETCRTGLDGGPKFCCKKDEVCPKDVFVTITPKPLSSVLNPPATNTLGSTLRTEISKISTALGNALTSLFSRFRR
jgi:hypothetical protein